MLTLKSKLTCAIKKSFEQSEKWFKNTSKELLSHNYHGGLLGGVPDEVVMGIPRKLILYTDHEDDYTIIEEGFQAKFENACILLKIKYDFEILHYIKSEIRKTLKGLDSE